MREKSHAEPDEEPGGTFHAHVVFLYIPGPYRVRSFRTL